MLRLCQMSHGRRYGEIPRGNGGNFWQSLLANQCRLGWATAYLGLGVLVRYRATPLGDADARGTRDAAALGDADIDGFHRSQVLRHRIVGDRIIRKKHRYRGLVRKPIHPHAHSSRDSAVFVDPGVQPVQLHCAESGYGSDTGVKERHNGETRLNLGLLEPRGQLQDPFERHVRQISTRVIRSLRGTHRFSERRGNRDGERNVADEPPGGHDLRRSCAGVDGRDPVIRFGARQFVLGEGGAGEYPARKACTRADTSGFELGRLRGVQQLYCAQLATAGHGYVTKWQGEPGKRSCVVLEELDPGSNRWRFQRQRAGVLMLPHTMSVITARIGQRNGRATVHQRVVHRLNLAEYPVDEHRVDMQMVNTYTDGEVVVTLDDREPEAVPFQRARRAQDVVLPLRWRHLAGSYRNQFDVARILDGMPGDVACIVRFEPAPIGIVPAKVRVDDKGHRANIALAGDVPGGNAQPRHIEPTGQVIAIATHMSGLDVARRHRAYRSLPGFLQRCGRKAPMYD